MKKTIIACLALLLAAAILSPAYARKGGNPIKADKGIRHHGRVTAISSTSITITPKKASAETFALTAATTIKVDGAPGAVGGITPGMHAVVHSVDGVTAADIHAHTGKAEVASPAAVIPAK